MSNVESTDNYINRLRGAVNVSEAEDEELIEQVSAENGYPEDNLTLTLYGGVESIRELLRIVIQRVRERVNLDLAVERERLEKEADDSEEDEEPLNTTTTKK